MLASVLDQQCLAVLTLKALRSVYIGEIALIAATPPLTSTYNNRFKKLPVGLCERGLQSSPVDYGLETGPDLAQGQVPVRGLMAGLFL